MHPVATARRTVNVEIASGVTRLFTLVATSIILMCQPALSQWRGIRLATMDVHGCAIMDTTLFVSHKNGPTSEIRYSTDNGETWKSSKSFGSEDSMSLHLSGTTLIAAGNRHLYWSSDAGAQWQSANGADTGYTACTHFTEIGAWTIGCAADGKIWRSSDAGQNWSSRPNNSFLTCTGLVTSKTGTLLHESYSLFASSTGRSIFRSTDLGTTWTRVNGDSLPSGIGALAAQSRLSSVGGVLRYVTTLYAATLANGIFSSTDGAATWMKIGSGIENLSPSTILIIDQTLLCGTRSNGAFILAPGDSVCRQAFGFPTMGILSLAGKGSTVLAGTRGFGLFRSTDTGIHWTQKSKGLVAGGYTYVLAVTDAALFTGPGFDFLARTTNRGQDWEISGPPQGFITIDAGLGAYVFAGFANKMHRSTDLGRTWDSRTLPGNIMDIGHTELGGILYAGTNAGVLLSTDLGETWAKPPGTWTDAATVTAIHSTSERVGSSFVITLYAGTSRGEVFYSTNTGVSWIKTTFPDTTQVNAITVQGDFLLVSTDRGVSRSGDFGATWESARTGLYTGAVHSFASYNGVLFAGATGCYASTNSGATWSDVSDYAWAVRFNEIQVHRDTLFAATGDGVLYRPLSEIVTDVGQTTESVPMAYALSQNYPNPFNPKTIIEYTIGGARGQGSGTSVRLSVYDILGREVAVLVNERKLPGSYRIEFDGSRLSSGVYFYRLEAQGFSQTRTFVLMK